MTRADELTGALGELLGVAPDIEAAAVVSGDGLPMASVLPDYVEEDRLAAMSAALLTLGQRAAGGLRKGDLGQVFVEGSNGHVVLMASGEDAVLVALTSPRAKVGLVLFEMRQAAETIARILGGREGAPADQVADAPALAAEVPPSNAEAQGPSEWTPEDVGESPGFLEDIDERLASWPAVQPGPPSSGPPETAPETSSPPSGPLARGERPETSSQ